MIVSPGIIGIHIQGFQIVSDSFIRVTPEEIGFRELIKVFFFKRKRLGQDPEMLPFFSGVRIDTCQEGLQPVKVIFDKGLFVFQGSEEALFCVFIVFSKKMNFGKLEMRQAELRAVLDGSFVFGIGLVRIQFFFRPPPLL